MSKTLFFFVKVFDNKKYADDFMKGKLFANRLSFFKKLEEKAEANRGDRHEGVLSWHQKDDIELMINGRLITELAGPVITRMNWHDHLNIFCVYSGHSGDFNSVDCDNLSSLKKQLEIPSDCLELGQYAVVVTKVNEFLERVKLAIEKSGYGLSAGLVNYYDPESFSGYFSEENAVFNKHREYEHQREYRFAIDTGTEGEEAITLDVGDISDITMLCNTADFNKLLEIKLPELDEA
ncbi:hypothetical protein WAX88_20965 (plasmid) [Photobacterium damselae subsp. damselae]|uniref:hypothetical protein n=1 Tax=Photobacterium damselae TaxID=38293 RepID=UPI001F19CA4E|nr:hypothetical protein [Photobacterium damselae]UKA31771.1 hypothetical protein IPQ37_21095 [Photobacterium damselae subsp. damselae]